MMKNAMRQTFAALALVAGLGSIAPTMAHAATPLRSFMFGLPSTTMSKADWAAFHVAAGKLLAQMPSTIGQSENWQGPNGTQGTITIEKIYEKHDMPCRDLQALFNGKHTGRTLHYSLAVCRDAQGEWRLGS